MSPSTESTPTPRPFNTLAAFLGLLFVLSLQPPAAIAQDTTFTYQGQLRQNSEPFTGTANLEFRLYDGLISGNEIGSVQSLSAVPIEDGLFQVELEFGAAAFDGSERFLEVTVDGAMLVPRQKVTATPYALLATGLASGSVDGGSVDPNEIQLRVDGTCSSGEAIRVINQDGSVICEDDVLSAPGWALNGNAGTNPATNFIGTTDSAALELRTSNVRSLRIEPSTEQINGEPITINIIGGSSANLVSAGVRGATLSGGGTPGEGDPDYVLEIPNRITDHYGTVAGGFGNTAGDGGGTVADRPLATVGGGANNRASGVTSTISGGRFNEAGGTNSTVGGGFVNNSSGLAATIGGGQSNIATQQHSTVAGGTDNQASADGSAIGGGDSNWASGDFSVVAGGSANQATATNSAVGGGQSNIATQQHSTVAGGTDNQASADGSAIGGGDSNWASGDFSVVAGGSANQATATNSAVGGGASNQATGVGSTVGSGVSNLASGTESTVAGGSSNVASGFGSTAGGGSNNEAAGDYSFVVGLRAKNSNAAHSGVFMFADSQNADFVSSRANAFFVRAEGGAEFRVDDFGLRAFSNAFGVNGAAVQARSESSNGIAIYGVSTSTDSTLVLNNGGTGDIIRGFNGGALRLQLQSDGDLLIGGSLTQNSDRNRKKDIESIDVHAVLDALRDLPLFSWRYRHDRDAAQHIGPMAQDFHDAFGYGASPNGISVVDAQGVALAAIQALAQQNRGLNARLEAVEEQKIELKGRLAQLEDRQRAELAVLRSELQILRQQNGQSSPSIPASSEQLAITAEVNQ